jgi:predicted alpha/beta-fold hydrolase
MSAMQAYRAPWWLPGGHAQTIWPALFSRPHLAEAPPYVRERCRAPDGDFIDVDQVPAGAAPPGSCCSTGWRARR